MKNWAFYSMCELVSVLCSRPLKIPGMYTELYYPLFPLCFPANMPNLMGWNLNVMLQPSNWRYLGNYYTNFILKLYLQISNAPSIMLSNPTKIFWSNGSLNHWDNYFTIYFIALSQNFKNLFDHWQNRSIRRKISHIPATKSSSL